MICSISIGISELLSFKNICFWRIMTTDNRNRNTSESVTAVDDPFRNDVGNAIRSQSASASVSRSRKPHNPYAAIRGIVKLFKFYFEVKDSRGKIRRLPRQESDKRWESYRKKVYEDYGKVVKATLNGEKTWVKRYSRALDFLKYKLKRSKDLLLKDLAPADLAYYYEIGGTADVSALFKRQRNVDSITSALSRPYKRRRLNSSTTLDLTSNSSQSRDMALSADLNIPPDLPHPPKLEDGQYTEALRALEGKMTVYEQEQVEKKRAETRILFNEKCSVIVEKLRSTLTQCPEIIGMMPFCSTEQQMSSAFDYWISQNVDVIASEIRDAGTFMIQIGSLRADHNAWTNFVHGWKLHRILDKDDFRKTWSWVVQELNVETKSDKREMDDSDPDATVSM